MGMLYQVIEDKVEYLSENLEKGLRYIGKAMQCIDELKGGDSMGFRSGGNNMGYREDGYSDDSMGMRRGRGGYRMGNRSMYREPYMD